MKLETNLPEIKLKNSILPIILVGLMIVGLGLFLVLIEKQNLSGGITVAFGLLVLILSSKKEFVFNLDYKKIIWQNNFLFFKRNGEYNFSDVKNILIKGFRSKENNGGYILALELEDEIKDMGNEQSTSVKFIQEKMKQKLKIMADEISINTGIPVKEIAIPTKEEARELKKKEYERMKEEYAKKKEEKN